MADVAFAVSARPLDAHTSLIALEGHLDLRSAPRLKRALLAELDAGRERLIADLSMVTFMDSTALGVLVGVRWNLSGDGALVLVGANPAFLKLFEITGLQYTFEMFSTVDDALAVLRRRPLHGPDRAEHPAEALGERAQAGGVGREGDVVSYEDEDLRLSLSGDAAVVLGIAATAMPFAESMHAQAERWLRLLSRYGVAATALTSLGFTEERRESSFEREAGSHVGPAADPDPMPVVTSRSRQIADQRGAQTVSTAHVLRAVLDVYGEAFERVLAHHGVGGKDLIGALDRLSDSDRATGSARS